MVAALALGARLSLPYDMPRRTKPTVVQFFVTGSDESMCQRLAGRPVAAAAAARLRSGSRSNRGFPHAIRHISERCPFEKDSRNKIDRLIHNYNVVNV